MSFNVQLQGNGETIYGTYAQWNVLQLSEISFLKTYNDLEECLLYNVKGQK